MKDRSPLGDVPIAEFRRQLHKLADWIADYRETIGDIRVAPNDKPGAIRAALPAQPPEHGESFENILADVDRLIVPGMVHWSHPMFLGYFGWTATAPGLLGEIVTAPLNVNAMTWRTSPAATELETVVIDWLRQWMGLPKQFDGVVYDTASVGIMHALAAVDLRCCRNLNGWPKAGPKRIPSLSIRTRPFMFRWTSAFSTCGTWSDCGASSPLSRNICGETRSRLKKITWTTAFN